MPLPEPELDPELIEYDGLLSEAIRTHQTVSGDLSRMRWPDSFHLGTCEAFEYNAKRLLMCAERIASLTRERLKRREASKRQH